MEFDSTNPMFWVQGVRGLYIGLEDGIHKGNPKGQICLDESTQESLFHIVETVMKQDMGELPKLIPDGMDIYENIKGCLKNKDSIVAWCAAEADRCSIDSIVKHSQSQMFQLIAKGNDIKSLARDFPPGTSSEFYELAFKAGQDIGGAIRIATGYGKGEDQKARTSAANNYKQTKGKYWSVLTKIYAYWS